MWYEDKPFAPDITVYEDERPPFVDTGLFDSAGTKLYRPVERVKIGFDLTPRVDAAS